jgi:raffinose/stachyose/melibiose transport system permease protein
MHRSETRKRLRGTLFVLPAFFVHFLIVTLPGLTLFYYGLTDWNGLGRPKFVGAGNFLKMLRDDRFHSAILNNVIWTAFFFVVPIAFGLAAALAVVKLRRSQMLFRSILFLPYVVSAVVVGRVFSILYSPYIGVTSIFRLLGWEGLGSISLLTGTKTALFAVAYADHWHWWGFVMVLFLSALHQVNPDLYEVADIEGASGLQKFLFVTLPSILPTLATLYMITLIGSFLTFDYVYVMTKGGPAGATEIASTWIYKKGLFDYEAGYASLLSLMICFLCVGFYFIFRGLQRRGVRV